MAGSSYKYITVGVWAAERKIKMYFQLCERPAVAV